MTTLAVMKARIARELRRSDLTAAIADAIQTAVDTYNEEAWFFSQSRDCVFNTVAGQTYYTATDQAMLGQLEKIAFATVSIGVNPFSLKGMHPEEFELRSNSGTFTGVPSHYSLWAGKLGIWPTPGAVYPIRIAGTFAAAFPASDDEAGNPWMTEAEKLIRLTAKQELFTHEIRNLPMAEAMQPGIDDVISQITARTARKSRQGGYIVEAFE